jgi:protein involved in polysaccharide export with SLBB domain
LASRRLARLAVLPLAGLLALPFLCALAGCESKGFLNPSELVDPDESNKLAANGRARARVQNILQELDLGVTPVPTSFTTARDVQSADMFVNAADYRIGPSDLVQVSIGELAPGQTYVQPLRVSETGALTLPDIPDPQHRQVQVAGLTELEAVQAIEQAYIDAGVFVERPPVSLIVVEPASKVFNITGNVARPGRYVLTTANYRMYDALTQAGGAVDPEVNSEHAFVIRSRGGPGAVNGQQRNQRDPLQPGSAITPQERDPQWPFQEPVMASAGQTGGQPQQPAGQPGDFQFQQPQPPADTEIIRVPLQALLRGQLQYNIVIRPEDTIIVPPPTTGEYYVGGNVNTAGVFTILPGRKLTMKQAIVSARMPSELAIPSRTQLIRRVDSQDVFVRVDLAKVFVGEEPDVFLQPNDMILVGSNAIAPFLASFRNAFRVTYGFGFLYDRNFAYDSDERFGF